MIISTCSYAKYTPDMGVPIRATYGGTPTGLPYKVRHNVLELAPDLDMRMMGFDQFRAAYLRKLDAYGIKTAGRLLVGILATERADLEHTAAVLLTGTDLTAPGAWCSRTILAGWITEGTGTLVAELAGLPADGAYVPAGIAPPGLPLGYHDESGTPTMF